MVINSPLVHMDDHDWVTKYRQKKKDIERYQNNNDGKLHPTPEKFLK